jgi:hypothetical protein
MGGSVGVPAACGDLASSVRPTELFASVSHPGRYLTADRFTDEASWRAFLAELA